jgi:hypothetical protein
MKGFQEEYEPTSLEFLVKLFREVPYTVKIEWTDCNSGLALIIIEYYSLTTVPVIGISGGADNVFTLAYYIDIFEFLRKEALPYQTVDNRWVSGVLTPTMKSLFSHSITAGEYLDRKQYAYTEYVLEYYFNYVTMYPYVAEEVFDDVKYYEQKGLNISEETRKELLSCFHLQKTRELYRSLGIDAVHWMNYIAADLKSPPEVDEETKIAQKTIDAIKAEATLLAQSIPNLTDMPSMEVLKSLKMKK